VEARDDLDSLAGLARRGGAAISPRAAPPARLLPRCAWS